MNNWTKATLVVLSGGGIISMIVLLCHLFPTIAIPALFTLLGLGFLFMIVALIKIEMDMHDTEDSINQIIKRIEEDRK